MLFDCFCRPVPQLSSGTDATTRKYPLTMPDSLDDLNRRLLTFATYAVSELATTDYAMSRPD